MVDHPRKPICTLAKISSQKGKEFSIKARYCMLKTTTTVSIMKNRQELQLKEKDLCSLNEVCLTNCITHNAEVHNAGSNLHNSYIGYANSTALL